MKSTVYYFTGTGNSLAVARDLSRLIQADLVSIPSFINQPAIPKGTDVMGIVFPVYHQGLPMIVKRFVDKLDGLSGTYVFAVCTSGNGPALSLKYLQKQLKAKGGELSGGFHVLMPYNYIRPTAARNFCNSFALRPTPPEKQHQMFAACQKQMRHVSEYVLFRKSGHIDVSARLIEHLVDALRLRSSLQKPVWLRAAGVTTQVDDPFPACIRWMDQGFNVLENCTGCGTCAIICPARSIDMIDGKPHWNHHCEQCFACLQWCHNEAIQFGTFPVQGRRYHHPEISRKDMIQTNRPAEAGQAQPAD